MNAVKCAVERLGRTRLSGEGPEGSGLFRALFDGLPFPVGAFRFRDGEFFLVDFNEAARSYSEGQVAELIGHPVSTYFADQPEVHELLARCLRERTTLTERIDYRFRTLPREAFLDVTLCPLSADLIAAIWVDVTESVKANEALRRSESRFRSVVDVLNEGVLVIDRDGVVRDCNPALLRLLGRRREEVVDRRADDPTWQWVCEDDTPCPTGGSPLNLAVGPHSPCTTAVRGTTRADGQRIWVSVGSEELRDEQTGERTGVVCSLTDVTQLLHAEGTLRDLSARLLRSKDEEGRRIARELHDSTAQNLAAASLSLATAARALPEPPPALSHALAECRELVERSAREVRTLSYLLHPPLLEEGGLPSAIACFADGLAERSGLVIDLEIPEDMGRLSRDIEIAVFRIVQESVGNAIRHARATRVVVRLAIVHHRLEIEVRDDGVGAASMKHSSRRQTTGVGIAGMKERARLLGGRLTVELGSTGGSVRGWLPLPRSTP